MRRKILKKQFLQGWSDSTEGNAFAFILLNCIPTPASDMVPWAHQNWFLSRARSNHRVWLNLPSILMYSSPFIIILYIYWRTNLLKQNLKFGVFLGTLPSPNNLYCIFLQAYYSLDALWIIIFIQKYIE